LHAAPLLSHAHAGRRFLMWNGYGFPHLH
jgi:hypothetical protein